MGQTTVLHSGIPRPTSPLTLSSSYIKCRPAQWRFSILPLFSQYWWKQPHSFPSRPPTYMCSQTWSNTASSVKSTPSLSRDSALKQVAFTSPVASKAVCCPLEIPASTVPGNFGKRSQPRARPLRMAVRRKKGRAPVKGSSCYGFHCSAMVWEVLWELGVSIDAPCSSSEASLGKNP